MNIFNIFFPKPIEPLQVDQPLCPENYHTIFSACEYASEFPIRFINDAHQIRQINMIPENLFPGGKGIEMEILFPAIGEAAYTLLSMVHSDHKYYPSVLRAYLWAIIHLQLVKKTPNQGFNLQELCVCSIFKILIDQDKCASDSYLSGHTRYHFLFNSFLSKHPHLSPFIFELLSNEDLRSLFRVGFNLSPHYILGISSILNASVKYLVDRFHLLQLEAYLGKEESQRVPTILKVNFSNFDSLSLLRLCPVIYQLLQAESKITELLHSHESYHLFVSYLNLIKESIQLKRHPYDRFRPNNEFRPKTNDEIISGCLNIMAWNHFQWDGKYSLIASLIEYNLMPLILLYEYSSDEQFLQVAQHLRYVNLVGFNDQALADQILDNCSSHVKWFVLDDCKLLKKNRSFPVCEEIAFKGLSAMEFNACQIENIQERFPKLISVTFDTDPKFPGRWEGSCPGFTMENPDPNSLTYTV